MTRAARSASHRPAMTLMQPMDAFFWYAQTAAPHIRPLVAGLFMLDRAPDPRRFRAALAALVAQLPRLQQRVHDPSLPIGMPYWADDPHFDLDYHLRSTTLGGEASERQLLDFAGAVFATPLDSLRPLWEGHLVHGLAGGRAAFLLKLHHSIMDGAGAVTLFDALTQAGRTESIRVPRMPRGASRSGGFPPIMGLAREAAHNAMSLAGSIAGALLSPLATADAMRRSLRRARGILTDLQMLPAIDPLAARCTGVGRRLDAVTLSLSQLRRLKLTLAISLNDLLLTIVAGAIGRYHQQHHLRVSEVSCVVPTNLREEQTRGTLGNRVGAFHVRLPIGERDVLRRLELIRRQTAPAKATRQGATYGALLQAVAVIPSAVFRAMARVVEGRVHLICSNVAGPPLQRYLAGAKIEAVFPFAPVLLGIPLSIAMVSYGDTCGIGIDADPAAIPDPELLGQYLRDEVRRIEALIHPRRRAEIKREATAASALYVVGNNGGARPQPRAVPPAQLSPESF
jgi:diacylglycerol O-acyltransferase / wax synthase